MKKFVAGCAFLVLLCSVLTLPAAVHAQERPSSSAETSQHSQPENPNAAIGGELAKTSNEAAGEEKDENGKFKYSKSVTWFGSLLGLSPQKAYWVSLVVNFALLGLFFYVLLRSKLPQMFRERTVTIQKGIREAQAASAEASRRLSEIEARLAKLDAEVSQIRSSAEGEAEGEEANIRAAAEEDKRKVLESVETEIDAITRNARRELKSYAASLAVDIAAHRIKVDERSDQALVREFVEQLGKDGQ